ncbi:hypothetical protein [Halopiger djelfimassiliensis]|uniref:hypothetical protein n=1 Tax=Halopiger djelfimassiliensis TaxID=1293047 RepID=UPI000677FD17|nr:hypothetical protein [Halopiger djelfimassiliensis]
MATHDPPAADGFVPFFRRYTKTWIHAVATAGLTAFGTLTIVHRWFVVLALASYVVPPVVLYLRRGGDRERESRPPTSNGADTGSGTGANASERPDASLERPPPNGSTAEPAAPDGDNRTGDSNSPLEGHDGAYWRSIDTPTSAALHDVTVAEPGRAYAVGTGGIVLADDHGTSTVLLADGPAAGGNDLFGADATADGTAVWVAGNSGTVGRIDADTGHHTDYTAPSGITDNWLGVAVGGPATEETILLINGSGAVLRGRYRDGDLAWTGPTTPGSGSSLCAVSMADQSVGYCCDTSDAVFETTDGGETFASVGPVGADGTLSDLTTGGRTDCRVSTDDGVVYRYEDTTWTPDRVTDASVTGITRHGDRTIVCTADGSIHERDERALEWERFGTDAPGSLHAVSSGEDRAVAVGDDGCVVERTRYSADRDG